HVRMLSPELAVSGVPDGQVAIVQDLRENLGFPGSQHSTWLRSSQKFFQRRLRPAESPQQNYYLDEIAKQFPGDTIWFRIDANQGVGSTICNYDSSMSRRADLSLGGYATVDLFQVKKIADLPLRSGSFSILPGRQGMVQNVRVSAGQIAVTLGEDSTQLLLDRELDTGGEDRNNRSFCSYVLYHPDSGEAFVALAPWAGRMQIRALLSAESHLGLELNFPYSALRERLAGVSAEDWLRQARLCVFAPRYAGTSKLTFHQDHFSVRPEAGENLRQQKEKEDDAQNITAATLPANPSRAQLDAYLDALLLHVPDRVDGVLRQTLEKKFMLLGADGLPALLRRLPLQPTVETWFVFPTIVKLIRPEQLPDLRAALQRDTRVLTVFRQKHWEADARDILVAKLPDHRERLSADALRIAAAGCDPARYPDLRWHFIHLDGGQDLVVAALERCPGFDTADAVREAWQSARLGVTDGRNLAAVAARYGLPDALNLAVRNATDAYSTDTQQRQLAA
ncbi:MAG TPA: hypothetical protein VF988_17475, partial [Verrucomicrobiae bacterium]